MNYLPRWFMVLVLVLAVIGLMLWARGPDHHHGDDEGALDATYSIPQGLGR